MKKITIIAYIIVVLAVVLLLIYRHFVPKARSFEEQTYPDA